MTIDGRRRDIGLGGFPVTSLAKARQISFQHRVAIAEGRDPLAERRRSQVPTFKEAAKLTFEAHRSAWKSGKHTKNWLQQMERYALPAIGDHLVDAIDREDVLGILTPIWPVRPQTARKLRQRIRAVLKWSQAHGYVEQNVAGEAIDGALPQMPKVKKHHRALPFWPGNTVERGTPFPLRIEVDVPVRVGVAREDHRKNRSEHLRLHESRSDVFGPSPVDSAGEHAGTRVHRLRGEGALERSESCHRPLTRRRS